MKAQRPPVAPPWPRTDSRDLDQIREQIGEEIGYLQDWADSVILALRTRSSDYLDFSVRNLSIYHQNIVALTVHLEDERRRRDGSAS